ncbi:hypothetical protein FJZ40_02405 [Candidatus Shapirobacteria bacterium]|nr:hypothetical protein [Candidatus Shapirobacteria bacterium]
MIHDSFEETFLGKQKILVIMGHPDDCEIVCGGTIARLAHSGRLVRLLVTTTGGKGFQNKDITEKEFTKVRLKEQISGGLELGISQKENFNLEIPDGELETSTENIAKVVYHIRDFKPDLIITHHPAKFIVEFSRTSHWVNHRDHRNTGIIAFDAAYPCARDRGFFPEQFQVGLAPHKVHDFLLADSYGDENVRYFQIDKYIGQKKKALMAHKSVFSKQDVEDLVGENRREGNYLEPLGFISIY